MTSAADSAASRLARELSVDDDVSIEDAGRAAPDSFDAVLDLLFELPANTSVSQAVDQILADDARRTLPADRRSRLIAALDETLAERRQTQESLINILRQRRRTDNITLAEMARQLESLAAERDREASSPHITCDQLRDIEDGEALLRGSDVVRTLALWSIFAGLTADGATQAFRRSVRTASRQAPLRSAAGRSGEAADLTADDEAVARFEQVLRRLSGTDG
jgi:hypothetical protein